MQKHTPFDAVCRALLEKHHRLWNQNADAILQRPSAEAVHAMRVEGRRLRAALRLFHKMLSKDAASFDTRIAAWGRDLGKLRDLDIHQAYVEEATRDWLPQELRQLASYRRTLASSRRRFCTALRPKLRSHDFQNLGSVLQKLISETSPQAAKPARRVARKLLKKAYRRLQRVSRELPAHPSRASLHRLRRVIRRLRYACEFFSPMGKHALKKLVHRLKEWQSLLGAHQDRVTGLRLLSHYIATRRTLSEEEKKSFHRLAQQLRGEKKELEETFLREWKEPPLRKIKSLLKKAV